MYTLGYVQTGATTPNNVASICTGLKVWLVSNFAQQRTKASNNMQQGVKQTQHVTCNNVGSCWPTMLRPFARSIRHLPINVPLQKQAHRKTLPLKSGAPIRLCECKWGFKGYRCFQPLMNFIATNCSHTFNRQCRNNRSRLPLF